MNMLWIVPVISKSLQLSINLIIFMLIIRWSIGRKDELVASDYFKVFLVATAFYLVFHFIIYVLLGKLVINDTTRVTLTI
jgi:hypothetical protein